MEPSENPYASPEAPADSAVQTRIQSLKWLRGAAIGIMIFAGLQLFGGVMWFLVLPFHIAFGLIYPRQLEVSVWLLILGWVASILVAIRAGYMLYCATHLHAAKNYRWARLSAILAMIGIFVPYFWWEVPFGIWAYLLLRKEKYKALFTIKPNHIR